jgi:hypothetical protein
VLLALGVVLVAAGLVLLLNLAGAGDFVIRRVTSRSLGELAPGFAATPWGFKIYAVLVLAVGVVGVGLGVAGSSAVLGSAILVLGVVAFVVASVIAIAGEVRTYRALKR